MIFIIIVVTIIIIALLFIAYFYNNNNKGKHKQNPKIKITPHCTRKAPLPVTTFLKKESLNNRSNISNLTINKEITEIEDNLFINFPKLSCIKVEDDNEVFCSKLGVLFTHDMSTIIFYPPLKQTSTYFIPQGVEEVNTHAFFNNKYIKYIILPTTLSYIGENAFVNCKYLNQVVIPENVTQIHPRAFALCPRITIRCYKGSVAEGFCKKYYIPFEYLTA